MRRPSLARLIGSILAVQPPSSERRTVISQPSVYLAQYEADLLAASERILASAIFGSATVAQLTTRKAAAAIAIEDAEF
jgi:hypothetical protein